MKKLQEKGILNKWALSNFDKFYLFVIGLVSVDL
jgi:hypothetical protein